MFGLLILCFFYVFKIYLFLKMCDHMNELDSMEEYENENFIGISLMESISDDDEWTENNEAPKLVSNEGLTKVQMVAYKRCSISNSNSLTLATRTHRFIKTVVL